ncbi:hypothetical protein Nepgr_006850 [Nepenthes gracilis]|uniref:Transcription elongation factor n=1 Tax=Nepenthes gracilis TaxID=150966 RepID=A0AAD3XHU0_NEPGR|nr:hypothetical protein Nepgr_006850 [Nepenthes gracilis]
MQKELVELFEAAKKAADAAAEDGGLAEESRCLDALKRLKDFPVNYQMLVATQVGKRLRHLAKHPRKKIQDFAADLIDKWKNIIIEETKNRKNGGSECEDSVKLEPANAVRTKKANPVKIEKASGADTVKVEKREQGISRRPEEIARMDTVKVERKLEKGTVVKTEISSSADAVKLNNGNVVKTENTSSAAYVKEVERITNQEKQAAYTAKKLPPVPNVPKLSSMIKCNDVNRDKMRELLFEALSRVSSEADAAIVREEVDACDPIRVAVSVESTMFETWGGSTGANKLKYRSTIFNLKDPKNPDFRRKVLLGQFRPEKIVTLTPEEMASDQRRAENQQIKDKALFECQRGGPPKATTDQFKCGRCGQRKCTYYQLQTRSADEPMTTFVTCVNCNNHWKFC